MSIYSRQTHHLMAARHLLIHSLINMPITRFLKNEILTILSSLALILYSPTIVQVLKYFNKLFMKKKKWQGFTLYFFL